MSTFATPLTGKPTRDLAGWFNQTILSHILFLGPQNLKQQVDFLNKYNQQEAKLCWFNMMIRFAEIEFSINSTKTSITQQASDLLLLLLQTNNSLFLSLSLF